MIPVSSVSLTAEWIDELLRLQSLETQLAALDSAGLLHAEGLSRLLDQAMRLARSDPGRARQLTMLCADAAGPAGAPAILPRATYLRAQTHAINGEFSLALDLIRSARDGYEAIGEPIEALRTNIGLMHVLNELGRHTEALEAGQSVLDAVGQQGERRPQAKMLAALAHLNRGVCFETTGRYEDALAAYDAAERLFAALEMTDRIGDVSNNRGIVLTHLGRIGEALQAFERAARIWAETGATLLQAQTLSNIGDAHLALGNYARGLDVLEQARRLFDTLDAVANRRILLRKLADAYLALNLYPEALAVYREAIDLLKDAGMADHRARALWGMGATLVAQSRYDQAESALAEAAALFEAAGNMPMWCSVLLERAALQQARSDHAAALHTARQALDRVSGDAWPVQRIYACMRLADLLLPDTAAAEPYLHEAQSLFSSLNLPPLDYGLSSRMGRLRLLQGRDQEAQAYLESAAARIETLRGNLAQEAIRASFLRDKVAVYEDLIQLHLAGLARGDARGIRQAFAAAEQAKSRTLVDLLTGVIAPATAPSGDPELGSQPVALRADLNATYNQLLETPAEPVSETFAELQGRASRLEHEISLLRLRAADHRASADPFATPLALDALQTHLPADLVLVAYHLVGDEVMAFVHGQGDLRVVRHLSRTPIVQHWLTRLSAQWDRFRAGGDFAQRHLAALEKSAQRVLHGLYAELVAPLEAELKRHARDETPMRLAIVPHGVLHQVPFHALHDGKRYLIDRFELSYAPSVTVLALCQQRPRREPKRALVVGVADDLIPAVNVEVQGVAQYLSQTDAKVEALMGDQAHLKAFGAAAPGCDVLHLACHGLFRSDNPMFSALKMHDGWLTAADAMQIDLQDALVTLSACESGRGSVLMGDDVIGLPRAFLGAGASSVVVSLWLAHDEVTMMLMSHWYQELRHHSGRAAALRAAQQTIRQRYPHPYYWAPFVLIGRR